MISTLGFDLSVHLCRKPYIEVKFYVRYFQWYASIRINIIMKWAARQKILWHFVLDAFLFYFWPRRFFRWCRKPLYRAWVLCNPIQQGPGLRFHMFGNMHCLCTVHTEHASVYTVGLNKRVPRPLSWNAGKFLLSKFAVKTKK